ncbi:MAG: YihY/virulence factor BrkB family protein [Chitinophagales bacterium]|nr:YihY/virulence factor BrkB family protein [Chitinophagales bacterium]
MKKFIAEKGNSAYEYMKRKSLPGFDSIPIYDVLKFFNEEIKRDQLPLRAAAMSFNFLLAIFPSIIFLFTLIPFIPIKGLDIIIYNFFQEVLPVSGYQFLLSTITDIINIQRGGLLSFGFILAFYFSTNGVRMMMMAFNKNHPLYKKRGYWRRRAASARLTIYLFILFIASVFLIIAGDKVVDSLANWFGMENSTEKFFLSILQWLIIVALFFTSISLIYYYGPSAKDRWRFITPGASFATIGTIIASLGFAFFVNNFGLYNEVYGSIGTLIVLMVWLNINSLMLLVGFELNNSIDVNRLLRTKLSEATQEA